MFVEGKMNYIAFCVKKKQKNTVHRVKVLPACKQLVIAVDKYSIDYRLNVDYDYAIYSRHCFIWIIVCLLFVELLGTGSLELSIFVASYKHYIYNEIYT